MAEGRVAGAEVVQRDPHSQIPDMAKGDCRRDRVGHQDGLSYFEYEPAGSASRFINGLGHLVGDDVANELPAGQVHVHHEGFLAGAA